MKKMTIAITLSCAIALAACGKSQEANQSQTSTAPSAGSEQSAPALTEQQAEQVTEQSEQAAFETMDEAKDQTDEIGNTVDKASGEGTAD
jgi:hypothetical protein